MVVLTTFILKKVAQISFLIGQICLLCGAVKIGRAYVEYPDEVTVP